LLIHEEGRVTINEQGQGIYDYFIKDHLGNTRMMFTSAPRTDSYQAGMETANAEKERSEWNPSYDEVNNKGLLMNAYPRTGSRSLRLSGGSREGIGLGKVLHVVPGDTVTAHVYATYIEPTANDSYITPSALASAFLSAYGITGPEQSPLYNMLQDATYAATLFGTDNSTSASPKAYLNYILFDEDYQMQDAGFMRVPTSAQMSSSANYQKLEFASPVYVKKAGYLYLYLSNENEKLADVYFDDFSITHRQSPVQQESHYYPFGMQMDLLSYQRMGSRENRYLYNGKELQKDFELDWYDYGARMYDGQIGRWHVVDPLAHEFPHQSPYAAFNNNPIFYIDPDGRAAVPPGDYYDKNGAYLGNDGIDDGKVYQLKDSYRARFENKYVNWGGTLSESHYTELQSKSNDLGIADVKMTFTGKANLKNPKQADGQLNVIQVAGGKEFARVSFDAVGGPWGNGSPENGNYSVHTLQNRGKDGWYNEGMTKEGVGFSLNVDPLFKTGRSLIRIHPDGGKYFGTQGCVGLTCGSSGLLEFKGLSQSALSRQKSIPLNISILNNPNNNGYGKKVKSNGE
jgi:RHS repeat-associated protein